MGFVTLEEVIKYAVQREDDAVQLYTEAAKKTTSIAARKMFEEFVVEEMGHKKVFSQMDVAKAEQYRASQIPDMGISKFLVHIELKPDMTYQQILQFAIKTEENAYQLYKAAAEGTDDPQLKKTLEVFADVELGHKKRIEAIYDEKVLTEN